MSRLKVAAAQIECRSGDIPFNLARHLSAIDEARAAAADLLVFPELSLTDYLQYPDCKNLAMTTDSPPLAELAAKTGPMAVSVGCIERSPDGRYFNSQVLLAGGKVAGIHRKINLPGYGNLHEDKVYSGGVELAPVAHAGSWQLVTLICADAWNPALPWLAALRGANLALIPAASSHDAVGAGFDNPRGWTINLAHTALTYGLPIVFANHCGRRGSFDFWGGSRILDADARELAAAGNFPQLIFAEIDPAAGEDARRRLPTMTESNPALVRHLLDASIPQET
ncbi:MAG: hypothetical protein HY059_17315 [Proteobacteria bacterium]|nr:hypothetical protein [Pseudomonadota bacterium]